MAQPPAVDGALDDAAWRRAARFTAFRTLRPHPGRPPSQPTKVLLTADSENLYLAMRCGDDRPEGLRAEASDEGDMLHDDGVLFALDTYGDGLAAYFFGVNPGATRADGALSWEGRPDLGLNLRRAGHPFQQDADEQRVVVVVEESLTGRARGSRPCAASMTGSFSLSW